MVAGLSPHDVEELVHRIVRQALGADAVTLEHMTFGHSSRVYDVTLAGAAERHVIVRLNAHPHVFAGTRRTIDALRALGLPVPQLVVSDLTLERHPLAYVILEKIPGRDLRYELATMTRAQMTAVAEQVVAMQRAVGTLPQGDGYGFVPLGERGRARAWTAVVTRSVDQPAHRLRDAVQADLLETVRDSVNRHEAYLQSVPPTCFLDDLTTKNVIVERGVLRGIVDLDAVCYGDPVFWLGLTQTAVTCDDSVGIDAPFYVEELCRMFDVTPSGRAVVDLYAAIHALDFAASGQEGGKEEKRDAILEHVREWLRSSRR